MLRSPLRRAMRAVPVAVPPRSRSHWPSMTRSVRTGGALPVQMRTSSSTRAMARPSTRPALRRWPWFDSTRSMRIGVWSRVRSARPTARRPGATETRTGAINCRLGAPCADSMDSVPFHASPSLPGVSAPSPATANLNGWLRTLPSASARKRCARRVPSSVARTSRSNTFGAVTRCAVSSSCKGPSSPSRSCARPLAVSIRLPPCASCWARKVASTCGCLSVPETSPDSASAPLTPNCRRASCGASISTCMRSPAAPKLPRRLARLPATSSRASLGSRRWPRRWTLPSPVIGRPAYSLLRTVKRMAASIGQPVGSPSVPCVSNVALMRPLATLANRDGSNSARSPLKAKDWASSCLSVPDSVRRERPSETWALSTAICAASSTACACARRSPPARSSATCCVPPAKSTVTGPARRVFSSAPCSACRSS